MWRGPNLVFNVLLALLFVPLTWFSDELFGRAAHLTKSWLLIIWTVLVCFPLWVGQTRHLRATSLSPWWVLLDVTGILIWCGFLLLL